MAGSPVPAESRPPAEKRYILDAMKDDGFPKDVRHLEATQVSLGWLALDKAALLRVVWEAQKPREGPDFTASFRAVFGLDFWAVGKRLEAEDAIAPSDDDMPLCRSPVPAEEGKEEEMPLSIDPALMDTQLDLEEDRSPTPCVDMAASSAGCQADVVTEHAEVAGKDGPVLEILDSDDDLFYH